MPVILLCHCDGTNGSTTFTDVSASAHTLTPTLCTVNTGTPKFGTGAADFTAGGTSVLTVGGASGDFGIGSNQFTAEAWAYFTSAPGAGTVAIMSQWGLANNLGWFLGMGAGSLSFTYSTTGSDNPSVGAAYTPTLNTWIHIAADRDASNVLRVYANGVVTASATVSASIHSSSAGCVIGNDHSGVARHFLGQLDEVRFTMSQAQYGGAFTPPTGPFGGVTASPQAYAMVLA